MLMRGSEGKIVTPIFSLSGFEVMVVSSVTLVIPFFRLEEYAIVLYVGIIWVIIVQSNVFVFQLMVADGGQLDMYVNVPAALCPDMVFLMCWTIVVK